MKKQAKQWDGWEKSGKQNVHMFSNSISEKLKAGGPGEKIRKR